MEDKTKKIEDFFNYDMNIKAMLNNIIPNELDFADDDSKIKYINKLEKYLYQIKLYLNKMMLSYNIRIIKIFNEKIEELNKIIDTAYFFNQDYNSLMNFIQVNVTDMRQEFVENLYNEFKGYSLNSEIDFDVSKPNSINEYLHYVHFIVVNNDEFYREIPTIKALKNEIDWMGIYLRGIENDIGIELFEGVVNSGLFPDKSDCIDIINLNQKIIIMGRDLGHAAVIEVDLTNNEDILISYYIPINTNKALMSKVKGINVNSDTFATGKFITNRADLVNDLCGFMQTIPTDLDSNYEVDLRK